MRSQHNVVVFVKWLALAIALSVLVACTTGPRVVQHAFTFNLFSDSPEAELMAYRYGDSDLPVSWIPGPGDKGRVPQRSNVNGPMRVGESLYVKWRIKATGDVYEDTVDLRNRLPRDMTDHRVYFMIKGPQLYVYLIPPESKKLPAGSPPIGPRIYRDLDVKTIYPDLPKN